MNANPLVSIIVPVYNVAEYLPKCLDSIIAQTYKNWECILVNDGSTDKSEDICKEYVHREKRFKLITQENQGVSAARNAALEIIKGSYVTFVDSDDYIEEIFVEVLVQGMAGADMCVVDTILEDGPKAILYSSNYMQETLHSAEVVADILNNNILGSVWNKLFDLSIIRANRLKFDTSISYYEDTLFCIEYLACIKNRTVSHQKIKLYHYVVRSGVVFGAFKEKELSAFRAMNKIESIVNMYFPQCEDCVRTRNSMLIQREIYRMHRSKYDLKTYEHELQKRLRRDFRNVLKQKQILSIKKKLMISVMALSITVGCWIKDIVRK